MSEYVYDPILSVIDRLILENIPYHPLDIDHLSWILLAERVNDCYEFQLYGRQELFGRKLLAKLAVHTKQKVIYHHIFKYAKASEKEILLDAFKEIARRLPQISFPKEPK